MRQRIDLPRLVVAGTHSGVGKTTIATALMAALTRRGWRVQPFKIGPDFIDPSFHCAATGRIGHNLDGWMIPREWNERIFARCSQDADIAIVEGVMGLFDARDASSEAGSTAEMAKLLDAPVVLIVDASAMARSCAAVVRGFEEFDPDLRVEGVLFNRVAGAGHYDFLRPAIEQNCRTRPLGFLTSNPAISFPDRHLGLVMADEWLTGERVRDLADWIEAHIDLERLIEIARLAPALRVNAVAAPDVERRGRARVGIARDRAFCFYYQDNLDLLAACGCELVEFSPLADAELPRDLGGLYLGGGYPELHAAALSANRGMLEAIRRFARGGSPVYAECGGFMYLTRAIVDVDGIEHEMAGIFPVKTRMGRRLAALGYVEVEQLSSDPPLARGERARGHEFRYSTIEEMPPEIPRLYRAGGRTEGFRAGSVLGSYIHLHFASCPGFAERFAAACRERS
ncbi:MAG TPA: cobyrinate a,c-diamide synthase [Bryobacteraceae bacterium]|nr:cobyrinate a,c-diamide synthase [Bryobacteraceae bacterium]